MAQAIALALAAGFGHPQSEAIGHFAYRATHLGTHYSLDAELDPCANTWRGEGLVDVVGKLRGEMHGYAARYTHTPSEGRPPGPGQTWIAQDRRPLACIPAQVQIAYLAWAFPLHYPVCAREFAEGDLSAFGRCWGRGKSR